MINNPVFTYLLGVSMTAMILLILRRLLAGKIRPGWQKLLWLILLLRLLLPVLPQSPLSLMNLLPKKVEAPAVLSSEAIAVPPSGPASAQRETTAPYPILGTVWLAGSILLFGWFLGGACVFVRRKNRFTVAEDAETLELLYSCAQRIHLRRLPKLLYGADGPLLSGLLRPELILPPGFDRQEQEMIFLHELSHQKGHDNTWLGLSCILLCLNWYNPLIWLCWKSFREDLELACDEKVLNLAGNRQDYARLLLQLACPAVSPALAAMKGSRSAAVRRVHFAAAFRRPARWVGIPVVLLTLFAAVSCLTDPVTAKSGPVTADIPVDTAEFENADAAADQSGSDSFEWIASLSITLAAVDGSDSPDSLVIADLYYYADALPSSSSEKEPAFILKSRDEQFADLPSSLSLLVKTESAQYPVIIP
jgi:beta-lactamase regulating signal transducer with metallopeptidase domain